MSTTKSFNISKHQVWEAYKRVKANKGAAGVDNVSLAEFEENLKGNLYKLWNRLSSGSYFPPAVRVVKIPKGDNDERTLGIPTVSDRIAQMVAKLYLEPSLEPVFHVNSFGYRPRRSALDAVDVCRKKCWKYDWVVDLDIKGFFENLNHDLLMRAVTKHTDCRWLLLYVRRWLTAPMQQPNGELHERYKGTPQGGVISPLLANLFLHYAFDAWMDREFSYLPFERYADDVIVHCNSLNQAKFVLSKIKKRLKECQLELHPQKTKIVYCRDDNRRITFDNNSFDFLGFTFQPRLVKSRKGIFFVSFTPAISQKSANLIRSTMRKWKLHKKCNRTIFEIASWINPIIKGWINYYGQFRKTALAPIFSLLNVRLMKWAKWKYKKLKDHGRRTMHWLGNIAHKNPNLFAHWAMGIQPGTGR